MNPALLENIYNFIARDPRPSLAEVKKKFLPDVSAFRHHVFVFINERFSHYEDRGLMTRNTFNFLKANGDVELNLGEINGKHSEVIRSFDDILESVVSDPFEIAKYVDQYGKGYLSCDSWLEQLYADEEDEEGEGEESEEGEGEEGEGEEGEAVVTMDFQKPE